MVCGWRRRGKNWWGVWVHGCTGAWVYLWCVVCGCSGRCTARPSMLSSGRRARKWPFAPHRYSASWSFRLFFLLLFRVLAARARPITARSEPGPAELLSAGARMGFSKISSNHSPHMLKSIQKVSVHELPRARQWAIGARTGENATVQLWPTFNPAMSPRFGARSVPPPNPY